jgi:hypothetical protein
MFCRHCNRCVGYSGPPAPKPGESQDAMLPNNVMERFVSSSGCRLHALAKPVPKLVATGHSCAVRRGNQCHAAHVVENCHARFWPLEFDLQSEHTLVATAG